MKNGLVGNIVVVFGRNRFVWFGFQRGNAAQAGFHLADHIARGEFRQGFEIFGAFARSFFFAALFFRRFQFVFHGRSLAPDIFRCNSFLMCDQL